MNTVKHYVVVVAMYAAAISWTGSQSVAFKKMETRIEIAYEGDCKPCQAAVFQQALQQYQLPQLDSTGIRVIMSVDSVTVQP